MGSSGGYLLSGRIGGPLTEGGLPTFRPPRPRGPEGRPEGMSATDWIGFNRP